MIEHPTKGIIPFKMHDFQEDIVRQFKDNRFNIVNKSRQVGLSTTAADYALWVAMFNKNKKIIIVSIKEADAKEFLHKVKIAYYRLPQWMKGGKKAETDNVHTLKIAATNSVIESVSSSPSAARGKALTLLIIDECAHIEHIDSIWKSAIPALSRGGNAIVLSTPNGVGGMFHRKYAEAKTGDNDFNPIFVHWKQVPEYQESGWYEKMRPQFTDREWAQEYEGDFLGSGNTVVPGEKLKEIKESWIRKPIYANYNNMLWVWKKPVEGHYYVVAVDTSTGAGGDFSAFEILDVNEGEQVAEFRGKLPINEFCQIVHDTCTEYNEAYLLVENVGVGLATTNRLYNTLGYFNFYMQENLNTGKKTKKPGFSMNTKSKPLIVNAIQRYFVDGAWRAYSQRLYNELETFVWKGGGRAEAENGYNDDLAIALGIAFWGVDSALRDMPLEMAIKPGVTENLAENSENKNILPPPDVKLYEGLDNLDEDLSWLLGS